MYNYYNYIVMKFFKDVFVKCYIKLFEVNIIFIQIGDIEWLFFKVYGQSFMMYQICKMVVMVVMVVCCGVLFDFIKESYGF